MSTNSSNTLLTEQLLATARELQLLPSLKSFALAGGTNLALRIGHRKSIDLDLFSSNIVGIEGLKFICNELHELYGPNLLFCEIEDPDAGEQYCFIKSLLTRNDDLTIKIEILQNIALMDPFEDVKGIRLITKRDVGLLKLMSASNRMAKKDIYDLDHITDEIALADLMMMLVEKQATFNGDQYRSLFDLDREKSPIDDVGLLLAFDHTKYANRNLRPNHSNDIIDILPNNKDWRAARRSWKAKVTAYMRSLGLDAPGAIPIN